MTNRFVALGLIGTAYHVVLGVFAFGLAARYLPVFPQEQPR